MTMWRPILNGRKGPAYLALADAIAEGVSTGVLRPRDRLPTQRSVAYELRLSLNTVSRAYAEATRRGFLEGEVGRGTFVRVAGWQPVEAQPVRMARPLSGPIDFSLNLPFVGNAEAALAQTLESLSQSPVLSSYLHHDRSDDPRRHMEAGARWMGRLKLPDTGRSVMLCNGAQHGLLVALLALLRPGDVLLVEALTYAPVKSMARHLGLSLCPVAMDDDGLKPDALDDACASTRAKVLYCLPTLHTPTAITMSEARRREIAHVVEKRGLTVIEDDVFGFLPTQRPEPLACFVPDRAIFLTSVSKSIAPGLRVGYLQFPDRLRGSLQAATTMSTWMSPPLMSEIVSRWIIDGTADRLNAEQRNEALARHDLARQVLGPRLAGGDRSGFHVWLPLPDRWDLDAFCADSRRRGVEVQPASVFAVGDGAAPNAIRLCLSHETGRDRVRQGLAIIADLFDGAPEDAALIV